MPIEVEISVIFKPGYVNGRQDETDRQKQYETNHNIILRFGKIFEHRIAY
ncbi:hypothetical protein GCM10008920_13460 [Pediococcus acidilactici]|nr:hypothetical protein GCM10008920_13460 [Pediococcus acidilactici]